MPSWQARVFSAAIRALIRRGSWGDERALVRRARLLMGSPPAYRLLAVRGVRRTPVRETGAVGEWLIPGECVADGVVLYIHGGGFVACSAATHRPIAAALACFSRRRVLSIDYRRVPEHRFLAAQNDTVAAYEWLLSQGVGASSIAIAGDSAGGNLALSLALQIRDLNLPAPGCVVAFSPWTDLAGRSPSVRANDGRCAMFRTPNIATWATFVLGDGSPDDPRWSPVNADMHRLPPVLLHVGSTELLLDDSRRVHERIIAAGGSSRLELYDDVPHCWQMLVGLVPEAEASLRDAARFIVEHAAGGAAREATPA